MTPRNGSKDMWVGIGKQVISFVVGVVATAFILGSARQRVNDIVEWKKEVIPRIDRMDSQGTLSFDHFHDEYLRTQARQEEKIKELEKEIKQLERNKQ
jgi:sensor histidine kinase YesM